jgi:hypothetical protein
VARCLYADPIVEVNVRLFPDPLTVTIRARLDSRYCQDCPVTVEILDADDAVVDSCPMTFPAPAEGYSSCDLELPQPYNGPYTVRLTLDSGTTCWLPQERALPCAYKRGFGVPGLPSEGDLFCVSCLDTFASILTVIPSPVVAYDGPDGAKCWACTQYCDPILLPDTLSYSDACGTGTLQRVPSGGPLATASYVGCVNLAGVPVIRLTGEGEDECCEADTGSSVALVVASLRCRRLTEYGYDPDDPCDLGVEATVVKYYLYGTSSCVTDPPSFAVTGFLEAADCGVACVGDDDLMTGVSGVAVLCRPEEALACVRAVGITPGRGQVSAVSDGALSWEAARAGLAFDGSYPECPGGVVTPGLDGEDMEACLCEVPWTLTE